jgi:hypothetical protein
MTRNDVTFFPTCYVTAAALELISIKGLLFESFEIRYFFRGNEETPPEDGSNMFLRTLVTTYKTIRRHNTEDHNLSTGTVTM